MSSTTDTTDRKPAFAECWDCGERWKAFMLPLDVSKFPKRMQCPNCNAGMKRMGLCATEGPQAVTEPREGKQQ